MAGKPARLDSALDTAVKPTADLRTGRASVVVRRIRRCPVGAEPDAILAPVRQGVTTVSPAVDDPDEGPGAERGATEGHAAQAPAAAEDLGDAAEPVWTRAGGRTASADGALPAVVAVAVYVALAVLVFWHVWSSDPTTVSESGGDPYASMWFLRWFPWAVLHGHNPFYSGSANAPFGLNLLVNTSTLLVGALLSPVTLLVGPVAAFNTAITGALAGSATAGYFFVARFVRWRFAAFVGGLLYGFGPYEMARSAGHLNLAFVALPPVIMLMVHEIVVRQRGRPGRWGCALGLLLVAQFFVATEVLVTTVMVAALAVVVTAVVGRRRIRSHLRFALVGASWAVGVAAVLLAYPVWFAVAGPAHVHGAVQLVPQAYRADLLGPVVPDANQLFAPTGAARLAAHFANGPTENGSYLGVTLLVVVVVGTIAMWRRSPVVRVAAVTALAAFLLSLGGGLTVTGTPSSLASGLPLPERLFDKVPLLENLIPARFSLYVGLFAALVLGVVLDAARDSLTSGVTHRHARGRFRRRGAAAAWVLPGAIAVAALLPLAPQVPRTNVAPLRTPAYFTKAVFRLPRSSTVVFYPYPVASTLDAQAWQAVADLHVRMAGGRFLVPEPPAGRVGFWPTLGYTRPTLTAFTLNALYLGEPPPLTPSLRARLLDQWRTWHVTEVVAFPGRSPTPASAVSFFSAVLNSRPRPAPGGAETWRVVSR